MHFHVFILIIDPFIKTRVDMMQGNHKTYIVEAKINDETLVQFL